MQQGLNDFGEIGYAGPCPPGGQEHEYVFFIYALSEQLELPVDADAAAMTAAKSALIRPRAKSVIPIKSTPELSVRSLQ